jgi:hypothetical protein
MGTNTYFQEVVLRILWQLLTLCSYGRMLGQASLAVAACAGLQGAGPFITLGRGGVCRFEFE